MKAFAPRTLLHLEGLAVLLVAGCLYASLHLSWLYFAVFLLSPDLSMAGYLGGKKIGALCYNAIHTYAAPLLVFLLLLSLRKPEYYGIPLIWLAHLGLDRLLGYGLKYETDFKDTHLQRV